MVAFARYHAGMSILVLQHCATCGPGRLGMTLRDHGVRLDVRRPDQHEVDTPRGLPGDLDGVDGLIILGGPQNVTDIAQYPWMQQEAAYIKRCHEATLPIVGICLGAQLIAHALGGKVEARSKPQVGFDEVQITPAGQVEPVLGGIAWRHPQFFSCGQEIKQLPPGATLLAGSGATPVQAFKAGVRTFGFAYHFECDRPLLDALIGASTSMLSGAGVAEGYLAASIDQHYPTYARLSDRLSLNLATLCFPVMRRATA